VPSQNRIPVANYSKNSQLQWRGPRRVCTDFPVSPGPFQTSGTFKHKMKKSN
jgi:hypothetical protein